MKFRIRIHDMNFKGFLRALRTKQGFASAREQYEKLGAAKNLGMTLRNFQFVESGTNPPSAKFLGALLKQIPKDEFRNAVLAYFASHFEDEPDNPILEYLNQCLTHASENRQSVFEAPTSKVMMYSTEQMDLLAHNSDAMRLHHKLLLWEEIEPEYLQGREGAVKELVRLSLAQPSKSGGLLSTRDVYKVPTTDTSPPHVVRRAVNYLSAVQDVYVSSDGVPNQELSFALQLVTPTVAQLALERLVAFKKWVQSMASHEIGPDLVPFVYLGFGKSLGEREM